MGFGNVLYVLHWAATQQANGNNVRVLSTSALDPWRSAFSELEDLIVDIADVRISDRRVAPWSSGGRQALSASLLRGEVPADPSAPYDDFLRTYLAPGARRRGTRAQTQGHLTVNVRRGDYYTDVAARRNFGFDIVGYLGVALPATCSQDGPVTKIEVISDDPAWCEEHLGFMSQWTDAIDYLILDPVESFFVLSASARLVMTNSTFSYWAAYLGTVLRADDPRRVWAPRFFDREHPAGHDLLDARWSIVESIPGGWDEKELHQ